MTSDGTAHRRGSRSMRNAGGNRGASSTTSKGCLFCYNTARGLGSTSATGATDLRGRGSMRSAGRLTGDSRVFCYNTVRGLGAASSTTCTADLRSGDSVRSAGSNLGTGGYP